MGGSMKPVLDVHCHHAAQDDARAADLHGGELGALQRGVRLGDARDFDDGRWRSGQARHLQLADAFGEVGGADVHLLDQVFGHHIDHELSHAADVARRVLGDGAASGPVHHAEADDRRIGAQVVVRAEWRSVQPAVLIHAGHPRDGPRGHQPDQQVVDLARGSLVHLELHCILLIDPAYRTARASPKRAAMNRPACGLFVPYL